MENKVFQFSPDYTIHPGEYIDELLDVYGMKQTELALRLGITTKHLNNLISGKVSVTPEMAQGLQQVFQRTAKYWLLLQANYDLSIQKEKRREWFEVHKEECRKWLELFDYPMLVKQKYLKKNTSDDFERVEELLHFFGCADIASWNQMYCSELPAACRITGGAGARIGNTSSWLRQGQLIAQNAPVEMPMYDRRKFRQTLAEIRNLTLSEENFVPILIHLCEQAGVRLLLVRELPKSGISGAAFWIRNGEIPCIQMNLRYKKNDHFWFIFYHEAAHIVKEHKKYIFIDCEKREESDIEKEADKMAGNWLIPENDYLKFVKRNSFYEEDIVRFSSEIHIHPGVVVGRLQHDGKIPWSWHNRLKQSLEWE